MRAPFVLLLLATLSASPAALAQDAGEMVVRIGRLEATIRQLSGRIEQLEFQNRKLEEQLEKFQADVEFRLGEGGKGKPIAGAPAVVGAVPPVAPGAASPAARPRRGDAFDPAATPEQPGAPRPLGATPPSEPLPPPRRVPGSPPAPGAGVIPPLSATPPVGPPPAAVVPARPLPTGALPADPPSEDAPPAAPPPPGGRQPVDLAAPAPVVVPPPAPARVAVVAPTADPRLDFETAYGYVLRNDLTAATKAFEQFLKAHGKSRFVPDATYWLGESYFRRGLNREAAEQFLKVATDHATSSKAPDGMLKLGMALTALGARDQACSTLKEIDRKFPKASAVLKRDVERELKKARCA